MRRSYGIDVSYYQGTIDWTSVKAAGVEWVILRGGFGNSNVDTQFVNNITGAVAAGIENIGVYWFSYCSDDNTARVEAQFCLDTISPYKQYINLPVYFDWEEASYSYVQRTYGVSLTAAQIQQFAKTWCNEVKSAGYSTGIYSNKSNASGWFKTSNGYLWDDLNCEFWYARYGANNETSLFIIPAFEATALSEHPEMKILQYSDVGRISGINSQRVDLNVRYEDEPTPPTPPAPDPTSTVQSYHGIDYVEMRDADREVIGILDTAQSIIWHSLYYGVGDFEIYIRCTEDIVSLVNSTEYVTRPNNDEVGVIEKIEINDDLQNGKMMTISGRFAKSILDRRLIYNLSGKTNTATILRGNVETNIRTVVSDNAINCTNTARNIDIIQLGAVSGIGKIIVDENGAAAQKQVSYDNLLEYTDAVLQEYGMSAKMTLGTNRKLLYRVYEGIDRSATNADGNMPIIFAREYDNLSSSNYSLDTSQEKNVALIGGQGEGLDRFYALLGSKSGLSRREKWVDASSLSKEYEENEERKTYTDAQYAEMLKTKGKQEISQLNVVEDFSGTLDVTNGNWIYGTDYSLGDIVTVQDNDIGKYINVRITEIIEVQDENGFSIDAVYQGE